jgi:hypothetical protein
MNEEPGRRPVRVRDSETLRCCLCGAATRSGIFIRRNPDDVAYPYVSDDES